MNLTLEQAMARATKGPLMPHGNYLVRSVRGNPGQTVAWIPVDGPMDEQKPTQALLAHWYNRGPELVDSMNHAFRQIACREGQLSENEKLAMRTLQSAIARANTVTIPD